MTLHQGASLREQMEFEDLLTKIYSNKTPLNCQTQIPFSLYIPGWSRICCRDQAGSNSRDMHATCPKY